MENETKKDSAIIIGPVRLSWLNVFKPRMNDLNNTMEYSATLLIPKEPTTECSDPAGVVAKVNAAILAVMTEKFGEPKGPRWPKNWKNPLGEDESGEYHVIKTKSGEDRPPMLINGKREKVSAEDGWKSGDWGTVKIWPFAFDQTVNKGAAFKLNAIQFLYVGDALGGTGRTSPDEFPEVANASVPTKDDAPYNPHDDQDEDNPFA